MQMEKAIRMAQALVQIEGDCEVFEVGFFDMEEAITMAEALGAIGCTVSFEHPSKPMLTVHQAAVAAERKPGE